MFALILDTLLAVTAVYMLMKGHYGVTKQAAFAPLAVAVLDASCAAAIDPSLTPWLSTALILLQVVILGAAVTLAYEDAVHARNKRSRRTRRRQLAHSREAFRQALEQRRVSERHHRVCA